MCKAQKKKLYENKLTTILQQLHIENTEIRNSSQKVKDVCHWKQGRRMLSTADLWAREHFFCKHASSERRGLKNYICHKPDWFIQYNPLYCLLQSTGLRLNFHCNENSRSRNERSQNNGIPHHTSLF